MGSNYDRRSSSSVSRPRGLRDGQFDGDNGLSYENRPRARRGGDPRNASYVKRMRRLVLGVVTLMLVLVIYVVAMYSPLFEIKSIMASPTAHVSSETISTLAAVPGGSTLFNVDERGIAERLAANPWIASVDLSRKFPDQLVITVTERTARAIVMLSNGTEAWRMASDGCWLEPVAIQEATSDNGVASPADQARAQAAEEGLVYIEDVSALVKPEAGALCTDTAILGVMTYLDTFTSALRDQIALAKAASRESIAVVLANGIEVSLGAPVDISTKEQVVLGLMDQYPGQITYINVRVPTSPVWRGLDAQVTGDASGAGTDPVPIIGAASSGSQQQEDPETGTSGEDPEASTQWGVGTEEGGPGGPLDEGGYYSDSGVWIYAYHDANGTWINGYYDEDGSWVAIS